MALLHKEEIKKLLASNDKDSLFIDPILDDDQIGEATVDLRLGYDFLVSIMTRKPFIELGPSERQGRGVASYFQPTRRDIGDRFILYPNQVVLSTTLEYLSLPNSVYADLLSRSSYNRLGISINTMIQPGFRGCAGIELYNHGNNAVELVVGSRLIQARFVRVDADLRYQDTAQSRKYYGNVRPTTSRAGNDGDFKVLEKIRQSH